jgi:hypothetical protein
MFRARILTVAVVVILLAYGFLSLNIRPIADDYCAAAGVSSSGVIEYMSEMRRTWSGDFSQILAIAMLVGLPLALLPISVVGFTTLFFFILVFCCGMTFLFTRTTVFSELKSARLKTKFVMLVFVLIAWSGYWSIPSSTTLDTGYHLVLDADASFSAVFAWPVALVTYLTVPAVIGTLLLLRPKNNLIALFGSLFLGLVIGTSGYSFATAVLSTIIIFQLIPRFRYNFSKFLFFGVGIVSGIIISATSPGANSRADLLQEVRTQIDLDDLLRWMFVSFMELVASVFNLGVLAVFVIALISSRYLIAGLEISIQRNLYQKFLLGTAIFLLVYYGVISGSELLTYNAYWHLITFKAALFVFTYLFGIYVASRVKFKFVPSVFDRLGRSKSFLVIAIIVSSATFSLESSTIVQRSDLWVKGSAPLPGINDISPPGGWVDVCWQDFSRSRQLPSRG